MAWSCFCTLRGRTIFFGCVLLRAKALAYRAYAYQHVDGRHHPNMRAQTHVSTHLMDGVVALARLPPSPSWDNHGVQPPGLRHGLTLPTCCVVCAQPYALVCVLLTEAILHHLHYMRPTHPTPPELNIGSVGSAERCEGCGARKSCTRG